MLALDKVCFSYGETAVITDLSLTLPESGAVRVTGPSGCGKTTLLRLIAGLETPNGGKITRPSDLRISMVFQENRLFDWLTVRENVAIVCENAVLVQRALDAVQLADDAEKYPHQLSGGMQRRVAIARAMAYNGDLLILDEPFTGLDEALYRQIAARLREQFAQKLILLVTHSDEEAALFDATPLRL